MYKSPEISIIIPTLNEENHIEALLSRVCDSIDRVEVIVVDGGSTDHTLSKAREFPIQVMSTEASRAKQMNLGALSARGKLLYFVHADTLPPTNFLELIINSVENGNECGCFPFEFTANTGMRKINSYCTRFPFMVFRGGDQSLFMPTRIFKRINGFDESLALMEDYDIIRRIKKVSSFSILNDKIIVSSRKHIHNSYLWVNLSNLLIFSLYYAGVNTVYLKEYYSKLLS